MNITYPTIEMIKEVHAKTVDLSGGGLISILDSGRLESVLQNIQNDDYYPTFEDKLAHLFYCVCKFHCFSDGNKRLAITASALMLLHNGYLYCSVSFIREMENVSYHVAAGNISKELLLEIITAHLAQTSDDEELKLKILHAIAPLG